MTYTLEEARANLEQLLSDAEQGKEVVIERGANAAVRLVVEPKPDGTQVEKKVRIPGQYAGQFRYSNDWWKSLETDEELREYGFDIMIDDGKPDELSA